MTTWIRLLNPLSKKCVDGVVDDNPKGGDVDVSYADYMVTEGVKMPSTENLVKSMDPCVRDTLDGLKDDTPIGGDVMSPSVNDPEVEESVIRSVRDTTVEVVEGMNVDISSATGTEPVTAGSNCDNMVSSVVDTGAETADLPEQISMPTAGQAVDDTLNVDVEKLEILEDDCTSVINTGETIVEDILEGRVTVRPNVINSVIVNERDMKSVEVNDADVDTMSSVANSCDDDAETPPHGIVLRVLDISDIVAEETPREGETDSKMTLTLCLLLTLLRRRWILMLDQVLPTLLKQL
ncbi:hypothetical protein LIER_14627 [Lithospermum erythrorhizon]|uniref:Uncharacterized protein n=1 Tax=Lithospermum erythrorhizon TaxID=34254 RepID=A0AAV3PZT9_LITER